MEKIPEAKVVFSLVHNDFSVETWETLLFPQGDFPGKSIFHIFATEASTLPSFRNETVETVHRVTVSPLQPLRHNKMRRLRQLRRFWKNKSFQDGEEGTRYNRYNSSESTCSTSESVEAVGGTTGTTGTTVPEKQIPDSTFFGRVHRQPRHQPSPDVTSLRIKRNYKKASVL